MIRILLVFVILCGTVPLVSAHPFTEQTIPSLASNAPVGTTEVIVYFSEPVDINFSEIRVFDHTGDQIDNKDTAYYENELSLIVTTPPLEDGKHTASVKVLSKIDGHLVPSAFVFGVGDVIIKDTSVDVDTEIIFLPGAVARFPGLVGQTIVLGAIISSLLIWGIQNKRTIMDELQKVQMQHYSKFMTITGLGLILVFVSNVLMIAIQTIRLETTFFDVIGTYFGTVWVVRMGTTVALLIIWFVLNRQGRLTIKGQSLMLSISLVLIATTTIIGHGAASGEMGATILDYAHNLVAAVWIGGLVYLAMILLPALSQLNRTNESKMSLVIIPRFSIAFVIAVGIVIVTGPTLLWFLESDVSRITDSVFGQLIISKIVIAVIMVGLGGFFQFKLQREGTRNHTQNNIRRKLQRTLKIDVALGIALLGIVALLTNGTLPAGEIGPASAQQISYGYKAIEFTDDAKFDIELVPFTSGINTITVSVSDLNGNGLYDLDQVKVKVSNPSKNIVAIEIPMTQIVSDDTTRFQGDLTFGFSGEWLIEIEAQRTENVNESKMLNLLVKPRLGDMQMQVIEYEFPERVAPLNLIYDGHGSLWIGDTAAPKLWQFTIDTAEFESYTFDGLVITSLARDSMGRIWFLDTQRSQLGYLDPDTRQITTKIIPNVGPVISENRPISIQTDSDDVIWVTVTNKDKIVKYSPKDDTFDEFDLKRGSLPFALDIDDEQRVWYTATGTGDIGYIDRDGQIVTFAADPPLQGPESLLFDDDGTVWIGEHTGSGIARFDPILETFKRVPVLDPNALPFGMTFDRYGNIWFAEHTVDKLGVYDPDNNEMIEVPIPTNTSFVQFMTSDDNGDVWFAVQRGNKIGTVKITESLVAVQPQVESTKLRYVEVVTPFVTLGIVATALFYVKAVNDKRRLNELIES